MFVRLLDFYRLCLESVVCGMETGMCRMDCVCVDGEGYRLVCVGWRLVWM